MRDIAIVGSGPAGLSASLYTKRAGLSTDVYKGETTGGLLTTTEQIDNYLGLPEYSGSSMAESFTNHAVKLGVNMLSSTVVRIEQNADESFSVTSLSTGNQEESTKEYKAVIFAAGSKPRKLGVPGEDLEGVSWCAVCDGTFAEDEDVIVVGGGESAVEEAIYMSNIASKVTVLLRGIDFKATKPAVENLLSRSNVEVIFNSSIQSMHGDEDGNLSFVKLADNRDIPVYSVFEAIGQIPQSNLAEKHAEVYADGFISHSKTEGFFIAGDVADPEYRQVAIAVGDGAKAAIDAIRWLQKNKVN